MSKTKSSMMPGGSGGMAVLVVTTTLAACSGGVPGGQSLLSASWKGVDSGQLAAPATAAWCASGGLLEIMAIANDSGVAVLLYPTDGLRSGSFAVVDPLHQRVHAGAAALGARWTSEEAIVGFRGVSGGVRLRVENGSLAGDMDAKMLRPGFSAESLWFKGSFTGVRADSGPTACPPDSGQRRLPADSAPAASPHDSIRR
jgi:hypothetical protein